MKIAVLIQCHKDPRQINKMLDGMRHPDFSFFLHVDRKSAIGPELLRGEDIVLLPDEERVEVCWSRLSQVDATLNLFKCARARGDYDLFWLCSGQDFPIKSPERIARWLEEHRENDFLELFPSRSSGLDRENNYDKRNAIYFPEWMLGRENWRRAAKRLYMEITGGYGKTFRFARRAPVDGLDFYFGSSWICLTRRSLDWVMTYLDEHPEYHEFFKNCNCPDESFFHTLVMNSPYAEHRMDFLHYVEWPAGKSSPKVLTMADRQKLLDSDKLLARKFDREIDEQIMDFLEETIKG